jgi:hypothetical protein
MLSNSFAGNGASRCQAWTIGAEKSGFVPQIALAGVLLSRG